MKHTITLIPGDGIGPEITKAMQEVVEASGVEIAWEVQPAGAACIDEYGTPLPPATLDSIRKNQIAIKGPITTPVGTGFRSINVALRKALDLYVNLRPAVSIPGTGARYDGVDLVIVRENTEDLYAGIEFEEGSAGAKGLIDYVAAEGAGQIRPDSGITIKPISVTGTRRIVTWAFESAKANARLKVTAVHKANIQKFSDGLFLHTAQDVAAGYQAEMEFEDRIVDACCMGLVMDPTNFDVLVLPNLYGDIVSDLCAGMVGGLGIAPGANIGEHEAIFEPVHGSAPKHAGKNEANPTAEILSAVMMLRHIGEEEAAKRLDSALKAVIAKGESVTYDIKRTLTGSTDGAVSTSDFAAAIVKELG
ncbi:MAG: isocitrate/isopropylmalate dehydrogenase family protein [Coriobacteriales bacterium]|jgi:isocitrate dehydrogenase (NAD+)|nr:isocitrate/isopropylmalate dehydrogenase family protein [Coriobacteriales bacterium]